MVNNKEGAIEGKGKIGKDKKIKLWKMKVQERKISH